MKLRALAITALLIGLSVTALSQTLPYDVLIRNGRVLNGSGNPWLAAAAELDRMAVLARRGMEAGGIGLSSGLYYAPGSYAKTEEVIALAKIVGELGGVYESHIRDEADYSVGVVNAVLEVIRISEEG